MRWYVWHTLAIGICMNTKGDQLLLNCSTVNLFSLTVRSLSLLYSLNWGALRLLILSDHSTSPAKSSRPAAAPSAAAPSAAVPSPPWWPKLAASALLWCPSRETFFSNLNNDLDESSSWIWTKTLMSHLPQGKDPILMSPNGQEALFQMFFNHL